MALNRLKIGEFSRLSQVSVRMLRHYDKLRLLRPVHIDDESGYRYYTPEQLAELNRLLAYKDLGFSLEEIGRLMRGGLSPDQVTGMLKQRQAELRRERDEACARLRRVETRLNERDDPAETPSPYSVILKRVEPIYAASVRAVLPNYGDGRLLWTEMHPFLRQHGLPVASGHIYIYHDPEYREAEIDTEIAVPVPKDTVGAGAVTIRSVPGLECAAATIHRGDVNEIHGAYKALGVWITANGYRICGANRLVILHRGEARSEQVTEVLWPVQSGTVAAPDEP
jgi:DNA-binding transcriptional MerR regulator